MTYVASPTYSEDDASRAANLLQCLATARRHLDETSRSSSTEKQALLIASAVAAGWEEAEVRTALSSEDRVAEAIDDQGAQQTPARDVVPSSSM